MKNSAKKLSLGKTTISNLDATKMKQIAGGAIVMSNSGHATSGIK